MNRNIISAALIAAAAFAAAPSFAAGEADYNAQFPAAVSQRTRAEVVAEASKAARDAAVSVDSKSRVQAEVKSSLTRAEVRQAAAAAK
ncbi:hypothetical protein PSQ39_04675 [Curvibacter sp. HBC28]|uniref:DUF4148 domain-containing protein n=1 Tax=Curvibacter microcysteis TaxID=3026419 RepID=A0ABT5MBH2_9BURK|nr:hypothetical protein [Curvibacter sp. HBC28]MDD0813918.1 hypothetical protein [Curvibacter sp. HBC28]